MEQRFEYILGTAVYFNGMSDKVTHIVRFDSAAMVYPCCIKQGTLINMISGYALDPEECNIIAYRVPVKEQSIYTLEMEEQGFPLEKGMKARFLGEIGYYVGSLRNTIYYQEDLNSDMIYSCSNSAVSAAATEEERDEYNFQKWVKEVTKDYAPQTLSECVFKGLRIAYDFYKECYYLD